MLTIKCIEKARLHYGISLSLHPNFDTMDDCSKRVQTGCISFMSAEELAGARVTWDFIVAIQAVVLSCISLAI